MQGEKEASLTEEGGDLTSPGVVVAEGEEVEAVGVEKEELLIGTRMMMISVSILDHLLPTGTKYSHTV